MKKIVNCSGDSCNTVLDNFGVNSINSSKINRINKTLVENIDFTNDMFDNDVVSDLPNDCLNDSYIIELKFSYQKQIDYYNELLEEENKKLQELNWSGVGANPYVFDKKEVNNNINTIKSAINALEKQKKSISHLNLLQSKEVHNYYSSKNGIDISHLSIISTGSGNYSVSYNDYVKKYGSVSKVDFVEAVNKSHEGIFINIVGIDNNECDKIESLIEASKIDPELIKLYDWYCDNRGENYAFQYLNDMNDSFNQIIGKKRANDFLDTLKNSDDVSSLFLNHIGITGKGLDDGLSTFADGIKNWFNDSKSYSSNEYEKMYILQELSKSGKGYSSNYQLSQGIGNMLPSIFISCVPVVGQMAGTVSLGVSSGGNSYHNSLVRAMIRFELYLMVCCLVLVRRY